MRLTDVTLREGDQMPGRAYSTEARLEAGRALDALGVAFVQAGFPRVGERDQRAVATLAAELDAAVTAIARPLTDDVDAALAADADVVEVFAPVSDRQLTHALGKSYEEVLEMLTAAVDRATDGGATVHLTLVDAFRTDTDRLVAAFERFDSVEYLGLADTVGARTPWSVRAVLGDLAASVDLSRASVHFHDDLGVGTANVLAAYEAGVGKADVSVASLGERAGNASLEQVVVAGHLEYGESFGVTPTRVIPTAEAVLAALGESVDPRAPILGEEVTTHESGIHTAAMLREPSVFEPFDPATFGGERTLLFGRGTGRGGARQLLERAGFEPTDERIAAFLAALEEEGPLTTDEALDLASERFQ
jgi:isopropylmalate/homocitrate/citramalate synthase